MHSKDSSVARTTPIPAPASNFKGNVVKPPNMEVTILPNQPKSTKILIGNTEHPYGVRVGEMLDSTELYLEALEGRPDGLRDRLEQEGYIFVRGAIARERALRCRMAMLNHLSQKKAFKEGTEIDDAIIACPKDGGWTVDAETGGFVADREPDSAIEGWKKLGWSEELRSVYAGEDLKKMYTCLFGGPRGNTHDGFQMLPEVTWLRAKGKGEVTAEHADYYYFKENTNVFHDNAHPFVARDANATVETSPVMAKLIEDVVSAREAHAQLDEETTKEEKPAKRARTTKTSSIDLAPEQGQGEVKNPERNDVESGDNQDEDEDDEDDEDEICDPYDAPIDGRGTNPLDPAIQCDVCQLYYRKSEQNPPISAWSRDSQGEWHCLSCSRQPTPIYTCWISLGDYKSLNSSLCVMPRSQCLTEFYNPINGGLLPKDYPTLTQKKWGWQRGEFEPGDIVLFNVKTVHGASKNLAKSYRLSIDTRVAGRWFVPRTLYGAEADVRKDPSAATSHTSERAPRHLPLEFVIEQEKAKKAQDESPQSHVAKKKGAMGMGMGMGMSTSAKDKSPKKRKAVMK